MAEIYHHVVIRTTPETLYDALTTQRGLSHWWIADCTVKPEIGFVNEFRVVGHGINKMKIVDLQPGRRVEWECVNDEPDDGSDDQWISTHIIFEITLKSDICALSFRHTGWRDATEFFATCNYHWARHLGILVEFCESGRSPLNVEHERDEVRKVMSV